MVRAIQMGRNGMGTTAPNPAVGAVIVHNGKIIGEGFTSPFGGAHAEVNAIGAVSNHKLLRTSTLYVTLEPCSHFGKTPPCADLIVEKGIPKVVIGIQDPHEKVAGRGIEKLRGQGVEVVVGVSESACRHHHRRFLTFHEKKRPYIILKWAETGDGFIAPEKSARSKTAEPHWISNAYSRQRVHQWRAQEQAILVGTNTVLEDNPKLDVRLWKGKNPTRIVLDRNLKTPEGYHVMDGSVATIVLTERKMVLPEEKMVQSGEKIVQSDENLSVGMANETSIHTHDESSIVEGNVSSIDPEIRQDIPSTKDVDLNPVMPRTETIRFHRIDFSDKTVPNICRVLYEENIQSVLVEGGSQTLQSFIDAKLWDEARIFTGASFFEKGIPSPRISGKTIMRESMMSDILSILYREHSSVIGIPTK